MIKLTCEHCGKKYDSYPCFKGKSKFCSRKCYLEAHKYYRICQYCGKKFQVLMFEVNRGKNIYCSVKCQREGMKTGHMHQCPCGKWVYRKKVAEKFRHYYCCREHYAKYNLPNRKRENNGRLTT